MALKFSTKAGFAALAVAAGAGVSASPVYLDIGTNYAPGIDKVCATCTAIKTDLQFKYNSKTTITDTNGDGTISAGDTLSTIGGLAVPGSTFNGIGGSVSGTNAITTLLPGPQSFGLNADNGYGANWIMSFKVVGLSGVVTNNPTAVQAPQFAYGPGGQIQLLLSTDGATFVNFMNIDVLGGGATGISTALLGSVDFTGVSIANLASYGNLFHSATAQCGGSSGYYDIWKNCGGGAMPAGSMNISFLSTQDADVPASQFAYTAGATPQDGKFTVTTNHNGSARFDIPEPGSLALMGLALAGLGLTQRRRKTAK